MPLTRRFSEKPSSGYENLEIDSTDGKEEAMECRKIRLRKENKIAF